MFSNIMTSHFSQIAFIVLACTVALFSCSPGAGDGGVSATATCSGVHPIEDNQDANYVAFHIISRVEDVVNELPEGNYSRHEVSGIFGTMEITGIVSRTVNESCGTDCIARYNNHEIIANTLNYASATSPTVLTGVVNYSDTTGLQIDNGDSSVIGAITITDNGETILYKRVYVSSECNPEKNGVEDEIYSVSSSGVSSSYLDQRGVIVSTGGTFTF